MDEGLGWVQPVGSVLIVASVVPAVLFVVLYQLTADWRRQPLGPHVMTFMSVIAAVLVLSTVRQFTTGDTLWFLLLRLVVFAAVPFVLWWRVIILIKTQLRKRRQRMKGDKHGD